MILQTLKVISLITFRIIVWIILRFNSQFSFLHKFSVFFGLFTCLSIGLSGCSMITSSQKNSISKDPRRLAAEIAEPQGFKQALVKTKLFNFTTYQRHASFAEKKRQPLVIYIEGDGHAWESRHKLSKDPTPHNPLALRLAVLHANTNSHASDKNTKQNQNANAHANFNAKISQPTNISMSANIVYLARPCQYTDPSLDKACHPDIWSNLRFSEPIIASMNEAIDKLKQQLKPSEIHLVGYSGGAAVAVLIAARRNDITSLNTVAGDLDHQKMSQYHKTTPLVGSLNPIDFASKVAHIPQHHYVGAKDKIVPIFIAEDFVKEVAKIRSEKAKLSILPNVGHHQGWEGAWQYLVN